MPIFYLKKAFEKNFFAHIERGAPGEQPQYQKNFPPFKKIAGGGIFMKIPENPIFTKIRVSPQIFHPQSRDYTGMKAQLLGYNLVCRIISKATA